MDTMSFLHLKTWTFPRNLYYIEKVRFRFDFWQFTIKSKVVYVVCEGYIVSYAGVSCQKSNYEKNA